MPKKKHIRSFNFYIILAILLQSLVLLFINNKYLKSFSGESKIEVASNKNVSAKQEDQNSKKPVKVKLDENCSNINVSRNLKYVSYNKDNGLFFKASNGETSQEEIESTNLIAYKWLNNDEMILSEKVQSNFNFYLYDVKTKEKKLLNTLKLKDSNAKIEDIIVSPLKNLYFIKAKAFGNTSIYKLNVQNEFEKIDTVSSEVKDVALVPHEDKLVYTIANSNSIYVSYIKNKITFPEQGDLKILGIDDSDRVYVGVKNGNNVNKVYYGLISEDVKHWHEINLEKEINLNNIYSNYETSIYEVDNTANKIVDLINKKEIKFSGEFIAIQNGKIITKDGDNIVIQ